MRRLPAAALLFVIGCSERTDDPARYYPPPDRAQAALEAALTAWQNGAAPGPVPGTADPVVQFVDANRPPGQKLTAFTVLGVAPGDGPRVFTVRLTLDGTTEGVRARFVVLGVDPVWVFRHEDYEMLGHWDHPKAKK